ncbi:HAD family hydrolase [Asaia bogorensis]|uniref:Phosphatase n=1 Tax=Asaia bogorensis NBRC 16594 TaxID=1231624 RepID=A0AAN4U2D8_9PROT|nr:HAD family phosphatase [Asaia bogorensis]BAT19181.1 hydrolase/phosphatase/phosphohexomutase [Asaia bogorensis NBRC 16594]GBQ72931.1 phosphatase/phosphohexomutase [Asaia bogorensis NBRC 16594]GEL53534.1 phosphatase [Asaia bogorensis NBRC 16594]
MTTFNLNNYDFDAIIFDCDGTIADTLPVHFLTFKEALAEQGQVLTSEWYYARTGLSSSKLFDAYEKAFDVILDRAALLARCRVLYEAHLDVLREHSFTAEIARTHFGHVPMAVASAGLKSIVTATLRTLDLLELFDCVVTVEDVTHPKPAPDLYLLAASKLGVTPSRCLVFEDTEEGLEAAHNAGMRAVDVRPHLTIDER